MSATAKVAPVEVDVRYDRSTQIELAAQVPQLSLQLTGINITDQVSVDRANELIRAAKDWCDSVDRIMDPVREATHKAWKAAIKAQDDFKAPVLAPLGLLKAGVTKFIVAAQEEANRRRAAAEAEQRREAEREAKKVAAELRAAGLSKTEIAEARLEVKAAVLAIPVTVAPIVETSSGQSIRMLYSAEVTDMKQFIRHLAQDDFLLTLFFYSQAFKKAVESELRGEATKRKEAYSIPGTKLVKTPSGAWR